jgi:hypothetical protein
MLEDVKPGTPGPPAVYVTAFCLYRGLMALSDADRSYPQRAAARERALLELELDALARGEGPTYAQRQAMIRAFLIVQAERRSDPVARQMLDEDTDRRLESLTRWVARLRNAHARAA